METLNFNFDSPSATAARPATVCGVVGSGNLEVLIKPSSDSHCCTIQVKTSARGFGAIWTAVLAAFAARHPAGGTHLAINDMGATPAVVSLRLVQALSEYRGDAL
jgi:malonate decarboxylase delta subunit